MSQRSDTEREPQTVGLSATQIMASALAAVTTTWALSYLGVAGTVIGAGLASVVTVLGNHVYAQSIERTREQVRAYRPSRYASSRASSEHDADITPTVALEIPDVLEPVHEVTQERATPTPDGRGDDARRSRRPMVISVVVVFLLIMGAVTAFELLNGRTLSDTVRGTQGQGTTIFGGTGATAPVPTPTATSTGTPAPTATTSASTSSGGVVSTSTTTPTQTTTSAPGVTETSTAPTVTATP